MDLRSFPEARRPQSQFPAADERFRQSDGYEDVGFAEIIVIEKIIGSRAKSVGVERPALVGHGDSKLIFFVAFAVQRSKGVSLALRGIHEWHSQECEQGR